ncbi:MAG: hypothetical protein JXB50_01120 [Spirochaetes bacterium]|nr:hypothetical protein [Spirochaetota bacterium]
MSGAKKEILAVMSKVKSYIKSKGFNTAGSVADVLSDKIRDMCDKAMENTKNDKRKTVMDRDF